MEERSLQEIAEAWVALSTSGHKGIESDPHFWAFEEIDSLIRGDGRQGWEFVILILRQYDDERTLGLLAAGPLEDLLAQHGEQLIAAVEMEARQNPRFRKLLRGVWQNAMSADLWNRVQAAAKG